MIYKLKDIVQAKDGLLRGPFGSALKKSLFIPKDDGAYKVYEQSVPLQQNETLGRYYISGDYFQTKMSRFEVKPGDFLVSCSGVNYGAIIQLSDNAERGVINQALLRIRLNNDIVDSNYFLYLFRGLIFKKITSGTGDSTIPNFPPMDFVRNISFDLPPINEQRRIGKILRNIDDVININNNIISDLETTMKLVYSRYFVQFDFPDKNGRPYKSSGGEMIYNETIKREIPKGWRVLELGDIIKEAKKSSAQVNDAREKVGIYPFFTSGDEILDFDEYYVDGFNIFLNTGGNADIKSYYGKSAYSTDTWCISADKYSYMLFIFLDSIKEQINNNCFAGSGLKHLQKNAFRRIKIVAPEDSLLRMLNDLAQSSYQAISSYKTENKKLASLRDWLLPMLMNGQIKVSD